MYVLPFPLDEAKLRKREHHWEGHWIRNKWFLVVVQHLYCRAACTLGHSPPNNDTVSNHPMGPQDSATGNELNLPWKKCHQLRLLSTWKITIKIEVLSEYENTQNPCGNFNHHKAKQFHRCFTISVVFFVSPLRNLAADLCAIHYIVDLIFVLENQGKYFRK